MDERESITRGWFDVIHARDWDALAALYTPDATYVRSDGQSRGPQAIVSYLKGILDAFPDHSSRLDGVLLAPDAATVEWTERATHTAPYTGGALGTIDPTGKAFQVPIVEVFRFDGARISSQHEYYDLLSLLSQVGWLELFAKVLLPAPSN